MKRLVLQQCRSIVGHELLESCAPPKAQIVPTLQIWIEKKRKKQSSTVQECNVCLVMYGYSEEQNDWIASIWYQSMSL